MPKPTPAKTPGIPAAEIASQIDELGAISRQLAPHRLALVREETLRKLIRAHFDASPAEKEFQAVGEHFVAQIGARADLRSIDVKALIKSIGLKTYALIARTPTLEALAAGVPAAVAAAVVTSENAGPRSLKLFERGA